GAATCARAARGAAQEAAIALQLRRIVCPRASGEREETPMAYDVITFGEAMIRLSPPNFQRLEQARSLEVQVGGAELNTAVALARLGRSTAWVSRLTNNPLGRLIANRAREAGVNTELTVWTESDRVGVYFLEFGAAPRASNVLYDRKNSAIAGMQPDMIPWQRV